MQTLPRSQMGTDRRWQFTVGAVLLAVLLAYSGVGDLGGLIGIGSLWTKADYSHGFLVVPFAVYLLWRNRAQAPDPLAWPNWAGLPLLLGPLPLYLADADLNKAKEWVQGGCFVASLAGVLVTFVGPPPARRFGAVDWIAAGLCVSPLAYFAYFKLAGGGSEKVFWAACGLLLAGVVLSLVRRWAAVRWAAPALAMVLLALPLPGGVETEVSWQLRKVATAAAVPVFRLLGFPTFMPTPVELDVGGVQLAVQVACSGLSMLLAFVALTAAIAFLCPPGRRPLDRWLVFASSVPIAVFCNVIRIVASGLVLKAGWKEAFDLIVHSFAGWLMMPLALGLVWAEFKLIDWLLVPREKAASKEEVLRAALEPAAVRHPAAAFLPVPKPAGGTATAQRTQTDTPPPAGTLGDS